MAFKPVERNTIDIKKNDVGVAYTGVFVSRKDIQTELGPQAIWNFMADDDKPFSIYGFTSLNYSMEHVQVGQLCRITYKGKSPTKNKYGKYPHQVLVEIDDAENEGESIPF